MNRNDLIDLLMDLEHDLGKHLWLPLGMLAEDAGQTEVRAAVRQALLNTRIGPGGTRGAAGIWQDFLDEMGTAISELENFEDLEAAVEQALSWEERLELDSWQEDTAEDELDMDVDETDPDRHPEASMGTELDEPPIDRDELEDDFKQVGIEIRRIVESLRTVQE